MAKPCRIAFFAFIDGTEYDGYRKHDLENGIAYCEGLLKEGFKKEPLDNFDLKKFIAWAKKRLWTSSREGR